MKKLLAALGLVVLLLAGAALAYVLVKRHESRNIKGSSTVEFVTTEARVRSPLGGIVWPMNGYDPARLRAAPPELSFRPPYRPIWTFKAGSLVEFPPAIAFRTLYFTTNHGVLFALNSQYGNPRWRYRSGRCAAASTAVAGDLVYAAFLNRPPCNASGSQLDGEVVALNAHTGRVRWKRVIGPSESSPLVADGVVYVGDWRGSVYALDAETGKIIWTAKTGDKVKGGVAVSGNLLYVGSYDAHVYAFDTRRGKEVWRAASQPRLGTSGRFYATPAVAYDRVYIGATDGKMYSFGARSGKLRWSHGTGSYVYSSAAVWKEHVYVGSYDGYLYAFDAATGDLQWRFKTRGPISGSPTVIAGAVYISSLDQRTYALDARTGKLLWTWNDGKYAGAVPGTRRLYVVGNTRVYALATKDVATLP